MEYGKPKPWQEINVTGIVVYTRGSLYDAFSIDTRKKQGKQYSLLTPFT